MDAIKFNNIEEVESILKNSTKNKKLLKLNEKDEEGRNPLYRAISYKNIEIVKLLIEYANQHQIILELNEKNIYGDYPLLYAIFNNNIEIVKLLIDYANQHQIPLEYDKNTIFDIFQKNIFVRYLGFKPQIQKLLENYEKEKEWKKVNIYK